MLIDFSSLTPFAELLKEAGMRMENKKNHQDFPFHPIIQVQMYELKLIVEHLFWTE